MVKIELIYAVMKPFLFTMVIIAALYLEIIYEHPFASMLLGAPLCRTGEIQVYARETGAASCQKIFLENKTSK